MSLAPAARALWSLLALALLGCHRDGASGGGQICPSIAIQPHLSIELSPPLSQEGTVDVELETDAGKERCTLAIHDISGARPEGGAVRAPTTQTASTCQGLGVEGISSEGYVAGLAVGGTSAKVKVRLSREGKMLGESSFAPDYKPDVCGFVKPRVTLALAR